MTFHAPRKLYQSKLIEGGEGVGGWGQDRTLGLRHTDDVDRISVLIQHLKALNSC